MDSAEQLQQRQTLLKALKESWEETTGVRQFNLAYVPDKIRCYEHGWSVPIALGPAAGPSRALNNTLDELQDRVEERSHLVVSLFLDPRLERPTHENN